MTWPIDVSTVLLLLCWLRCARSYSQVSVMGIDPRGGVLARWAAQRACRDYAITVGALYGVWKLVLFLMFGEQ